MTSLNHLTPGNYVPAIAIDYAATDGTAVAVSAATPLPVAAVTDLAATSTPLGDTVAAVGNTLIGPFAPQIGRDIWIMLVGTGASGTAQLLRSTDGGATQWGLTAGGKPWAGWSFAEVSGVIANEAVVTASDAATYYLAIALTAGSVTYRLGQ